MVVQGRTDEYSTTRRLPDGTYEVQTSVEPVNFRDRKGQWAAIDTSLVKSGRAGYAFENAAGAVSVRFPEDGSAAPKVVESQDGSWVSMRLRGTAGSSARVEKDVAGAESRLSVGGVPGADEVSYTVMAGGVKEELRLDSPPAQQPEFVYEIDASADLTPRATKAGEIVFADRAGRTAFTIPAGVMWDSAPARSHLSDEVTYRIERIGQSRIQPASESTKSTAFADGRAWTVTVTPGLEWLRDPGRVYPVIIDPTLTAGPSQDCLLAKSAPNASFCGSGNPYVQAGKVNTSIQRRTALNFDFSAIPKGASVQHANVSLRTVLGTAYDPSKPIRIGVTRTGSAFTNQASWNSSGTGAWNAGSPAGPVTDTADVTGANGTPTWYYFNVADTIRDWQYDRRVQTGLLFRQVELNGAKANNVVSFYPSSATASRRPRLTVIYEEPGTTPDAGMRKHFGFEERALTDRIDARVNLGNGNLLVEQRDISVKGVAGWDMAMTRYYNSTTFDRTNGRMGRGWSTMFGGSVRLEFPDQATGGSKDTVHFWGPTGYRVTFDRIGATNFYERPEPGFDGDLEKVSGGYEVRFFDKSVYRFDDNGRLETTKDKNDNELSFTYLSSNEQQLDYVTDTRGRTMQLGYTQGLISSVSLRRPNNTEMLRWAYAYETPPGTNKPAVMTGAALVAVDGSAIGGTQTANDATVGAVTAYGYDSAGDLLSEITDARENSDPDPGGPGGTTRFTYDSVKKQQVATMTRERDDGDPPSVLRFYYTDDPRTNTLGGTSCTSADVGAGVPANQEGVSGTVVDAERPEPAVASDGVKDYTWYCVDKFSRIKRVLDANRKNRATDYNVNSNIEVASMEGTQAGTASYSYTYEGEDRLLLADPGESDGGGVPDRVPVQREL